MILKVYLPGRMKLCLGRKDSWLIQSRYYVWLWRRRYSRNKTRYIYPVGQN